MNTNCLVPKFLFGYSVIFAQKYVGDAGNPCVKKLVKRSN